MRAVIARLTLNSLYSIRVPFTWQSSQTYPVPPPSAVIGLFANALQRYKNDRNPRDYLNLIEDKLVWAGARLITPSIVKSYMTSSIVKWDSVFPFKATNALGRQFAFTKTVEVTLVLEDSRVASELHDAVRTTPLFFGDSESAVTVEDVCVVDAGYSKVKTIETVYPVPFRDTIVIRSGTGKLIPMHERCQERNNGRPLETYIIPVIEKKDVFIPSSLVVEVNGDLVIDINGLYAVKRGTPILTSQRPRRRR